MLLPTGYSAGALQVAQEGFPLPPKPYRPDALATRGAADA